jgi:hypothetical protein
MFHFSVRDLFEHSPVPPDPISSPGPAVIDDVLAVPDNVPAVPDDVPAVPDDVPAGGPIAGPRPRPGRTRNASPGVVNPGRRRRVDMEDDDDSDESGKYIL